MLSYSPSSNAASTIDMSALPPLPLLSDYATLSEHIGNILTNDKVETRRAIASGLSLLARGWADCLGSRQFRDGEIVVSNMIYDPTFLR